MPRASTSCSRSRSARASSSTTSSLLGMGGSSLAPEVLRRAFGGRALPRSRHHASGGDPAARGAARPRAHALPRLLEVGLDARDALAPRVLLGAAGGRGAQFAAITDPGSELERLAQERGFRAIFPGEPTIGGRYSALSPFGIVPAALMGVDVERLLDARARDGRRVPLRRRQSGARARALRSARAGGTGATRSASTRSVRASGSGSSSCSPSRPASRARGSCRRPASPPTGRTGSAARCALADPYELGQEFFRWEFATAVAGRVLGINPFDQPDVQAAKDRTNEVLARRRARRRARGLARRAARPGASEGDYVCIQAFVDPARGARAARRSPPRARETGCVVTSGLGPRYLHSTGQLHKGGPNTGLFVQVVDDDRRRAADPRPRLRLRAPDPRAGGRRLRALKERGRRVVRMRLEESDAARDGRPRPDGRT